MSVALIDLAADLVARARARGADAADAVAVNRFETEVAVQEGRVEKLEQAESREAGLRVFVGESSAVVSGSVLDAEGLDRLAAMAISMASAAPPDPFAGLAPPQPSAPPPTGLDLAAPDLPGAATLEDWSRAAEAAALAVPGVTRSSGSGASAARREIALVTSAGFSGSFIRTSTALSMSAIAGEGTAMERDYEYTSAIHPADLKPPEEVGRIAGERAVRRLHPRKIRSQAAPVVYDRRVAASLVGHLVSAVLGSAIARKSSYLLDALHTPVFPAGVDIIDDPHLPRGHASRPFDGEGIAGRKLKLIDSGTLMSWLLDLRSARQLGLQSTGHAARSTSSPPGPSSTNVYMAAGSVSPDALIAGLKSGVYVTELIGMGVNMVTGDYSRGAAGFWIENGELAYPVAEITIAGNLRSMFAHLTPADDLEFRGSTNAPTVCVEGMTIAGA
jgi:PmbA protein